MQCSPEGQYSTGQISRLRSLGISGHRVTDGAAVAGRLHRQSCRSGNHPGNHGVTIVIVPSVLFVLFVLSAPFALFALPPRLAARVIIPNFLS